MNYYFENPELYAEIKKIMKEWNDNQKDNLKVNEERPVIKHKLIKRIVPKPGHKVWEMNLETGHIKEAETRTSQELSTGHVSKRINMKEGHIYVSALNRKSSCKHFANMIVKAVNHEPSTVNSPNNLHK